ncbi:MAG: hypothetical protein ABEH56_05305 [Salinirussus sp.]
MDRRSWIVAGAVVVVVAGVSGWVAVMVLGSSAHGGGSYLDVNRVESPGPANQTVAFSELSADQQRVFERALQAEDLVAIPDDVDRNVWIQHRYVRYENDTYEVAVAVSG